MNRFEIAALLWGFTVALLFVVASVCITDTIRRGK